MTAELDHGGAAAPPRANGELAFEHPWQRRLFATTMALCDADLIEYATLREGLIGQISMRENANANAHAVGDPGDPGDPGGSGDPGGYWSSWQDALEALLATRGLCDPAELEHRAMAFAEHP